jgi:hypothetical protein
VVFPNPTGAATIVSGFRNPELSESTNRGRSIRFLVMPGRLSLVLKRPLYRSLCLFIGSGTGPKCHYTPATPDGMVTDAIYLGRPARFPQDDRLITNGESPRDYTTINENAALPYANYCRSGLEEWRIPRTDRKSSNLAGR